jgi:hypothetical protein
MEISREQTIACVNRWKAGKRSLGGAMREVRLPLRNFIFIIFWLAFASWLSLHSMFKLHEIGQGTWKLVWPALMFAGLFSLGDISQQEMKWLLTLSS